MEGGEDRPCPLEAGVQGHQRPSGSSAPALPLGSGCSVGTKFHWWIAGNQFARKVDTDHYETLMVGLKGKIGHKRPYRRGFSYEYPDQPDRGGNVAAFMRKAAKYLLEEEEAYKKWRTGGSGGTVRDVVDRRW